MPLSDIPEDVALLAGPQLFGHLFNYCLFGILTVQVYFYFLSFPEDPIRLKSLVYILYALECIQIILASLDAYAVLGKGWGDREALFQPHLMWLDASVLTGIISAIVQCYYAWRIYALSASAALSGVICLITLLQCCAAIASGIMTHILDNTTQAQQKTLTSTVVWLVSSATCDIVIAVSMLAYLSKSKQGLPSDALLTRLMRLAVESGSLTASVACLDLLFFVVFPHNNLHVMPTLVLTKVYTNTLMMLINSRARIRLWLMRAESPRLSRPLQWVLDNVSRNASDAGPGAHDFEEASRDPPFELVSWTMPMIEAYHTGTGNTEVAKPLTPLIPSFDAESSKASGSSSPNRWTFP